MNTLLNVNKNDDTFNDTQLLWEFPQRTHVYVAIAQWKLEWINVYGLWLNNMTTQLLSLYNFYGYIFTRDVPLWDHLKSNIVSTTRT